MKSLDQLRWQCRRGTLELDLILRGYLETQYSQASEDERKRFVALLEWEDGELLQVLLGNKTPDALGFEDLIDKIKLIRETDRPV